MPTYFVEAPHTAAECSAAGANFAKHPRAKEILDNTVWRCSFGEHIAYTIADFESEGEAKGMLEEPLRSKLVIKPVERYSYDDMMVAHQ